MRAEVSVYTEGKLGFWMYVLFWLTVKLDDELRVNKQQMPKPEAQFPEAVPPSSVHSVVV